MTFVIGVDAVNTVDAPSELAEISDGDVSSDILAVQEEDANSIMPIASMANGRRSVRRSWSAGIGMMAVLVEY